MITKTIEVLPYNPIWSQWYSQEADSIKQALATNLQVLHHIGSTSIPGMAAKPKIDIIGAIANPDKALEALTKIGYTHKGEWNIPGKYGLTKRDTININLHLFQGDHPEIEGNLLFRNYLRTHDQARDAYAQLKRDILTDDQACVVNQGIYPFVNYTLKKGDFIRSILRQAGFRRFRILRCIDPSEQQFAQKLYKQLGEER